MREYLFRGKKMEAKEENVNEFATGLMDATDGKKKRASEWIEGNLLKVNISSSVFYLIFGEQFAFNGIDTKSLLHARVDENTICQYTGKCDHRGVRIYEGDYVLFKNSDGDFTRYEIFWNETAWIAVRPGSTYPDDLDDYFADHCVVCGNIYDNPEWRVVS